MDVRNFITETLGSKPGDVARELGIPHTTVWSWVQNNRVPEWRKAKLAELAVARGKPFPAQLGAPLAPKRKGS